MITHLTASRVSQALLLLYPGSPHPSFPASGSRVVQCCSMLEFCRRGGKEPPLWNTQSNTTADHHWLHGGCSPFQPTLVSPPASLPPPPSRNSITCVVARNLLCVPRKSSSRLARDSGKQSAMDKAGSRGGWRSQAAGMKEGRKELHMETTGCGDSQAFVSMSYFHTIFPCWLGSLRKTLTSHTNE